MCIFFSVNFSKKEIFIIRDLIQDIIQMNDDMKVAVEMSDNAGFIIGASFEFTLHPQRF